MAAFTRSGLHKIECQCGAYLYGTIASLKTYGLPVCGCGQTFTPARREAAELLGLSNADVELFAQAVQAGVPADQAAVVIERRRAKAARARRLAALRATS